MELTKLNEDLSTRYHYLTFFQYVKYVNKKIYKYDISFMDKLINLPLRNIPSISNGLLIEFGIIPMQYSFLNTSDLLAEYKFEEYIDYVRVGKYEYYLTPRAFKICLLFTKNTDKYINYYSLIFECIYGYKEYKKLKDEFV
jgi:hypothetical protein